MIENVVLKSSQCQCTVIIPHRVLQLTTNSLWCVRDKAEPPTSQRVYVCASVRECKCVATASSMCVCVCVCHPERELCSQPDQRADDRRERERCSQRDVERESF